MKNRVEKERKKEVFFIKYRSLCKLKLFSIGLKTYLGNIFICLYFTDISL